MLGEVRGGTDKLWLVLLLKKPLRGVTEVAPTPPERIDERTG